MTRHDSHGVGLLALLRAEPEDRDNFLVYADWLSERGDIRGELIDRHHRGAADTDAFIAANAPALLGPISTYADTDLRLEWRLGFIHRAKVTILGVDAACAAVGALLGHESGRLLRSLEVKLLRPRQYRQIEDVLVQAPERPPIDELVLGRPGDFTPSDALIEAYPSLARPTEELIATAQRAIDAERRLRLRFASSALPHPLGAPFSASGALLGLRLEVEKKRAVGIVRALRACCPADILDAYACELLALFEVEGEAPQHKWLLDAASAFGGARYALAIGARLAGWSQKRAVEAIEGLAGVANPVATYELFAATQSQGRRAREAARVLHTNAGETTVATLIGAALTEASLEPLDDECRRRIAVLDERWLISLMLNGARFDRRDFLELFVDSPRRPRAERLVWAAYDAGQTRLFALDEAKTLPVGRAARFGVPYIDELRGPPRNEDAERVAAQIKTPLAGQLNRAWLLSERPTGTLSDAGIATAPMFLSTARMRVVGFEGATSFDNEWADAHGRTFWFGGQRIEILLQQRANGWSLVSSLGHGAIHPLPVLNELLLALGEAATAPQDVGYPRFDRTTTSVHCAVCGHAIATRVDAWHLQRWGYDGERTDGAIHEHCAPDSLELQFLLACGRRPAAQ